MADVEAAGGLRLNLGSGMRPLEGYENIDIHDGRPAYPLPYPEASAEEVRASHILEHFSWRGSLKVLADWVRVLRPGGILRVAVPDFDRIVDLYREGTDLPVEQYIVGGHTDEHDVHLSVWNRQKLTEAMEHVGLVDIREWTSGAGDCAALPVSLNLEGRKPGGERVESAEPAPRPRRIRRVTAAMSVPRLGFMDNFFSAFAALAPLRIPVRMHSGAFWGQCLERCIEEILAEDEPDAVLTIDYDTVFSREDVLRLIDLMERYPEADAICPWQAARWKDRPLATVLGDDGKPVAEVPREMFAGELTRIASGHFGLTLLWAEALKALPHPWFCGRPDPETGRWNERRIDDDAHFWRVWRSAGLHLYAANDVAVGHICEMVAWPDVNLEPIYQRVEEWRKKGKPQNIWRRGVGG